MDDRIPVHVEASDSVTRFGVTAQLSQSQKLTLVPRERVTPDTVVVLAVDRISDDILQSARELSRAGSRHFILVTTTLDDGELRAAVELGICAVVDRHDATPAKLERLVVKATQGESALPTEMLSRLFRQVSDLEHNTVSSRRLPVSGLTPRETQVLQLVADGLDTDEIALKLCYSSRTVKNILHAVTTRFCLRNRSHAVAYAMREGLI